MTDIQNGCDIEVTVLNMSYLKPTEIGKVYARNLWEAMIIIHHPITIHDGPEYMAKIDAMQNDLDRTGTAQYQSRTRRMVFEFRKVIR